MKSGQRLRENSLTEPEFTHLLSTFPLVPEPVKAAAVATFRAPNEPRTNVT